MITVRRSAERMQTRIGWLDSRHSFSFGEQYDPRSMAFRALRVLNEDRIAPGHGFGMHPHRDVEILTYMLDGALRHQDSLGTGAIIRRGDVQRITAGTGVLHSEFNASDTDTAHLLQVWITPAKTRLAPAYEQRHFTESDRNGRLRLIASRDGRDASLTVHQDVDVYASLLKRDATVTYFMDHERHLWIHAARGAVIVNDVTLGEGDSAAVTAEARLDFRSAANAEFLVFDLA
jgi:redox-sensitive bicupin YhaK (pirin superfamily)